MIRLALCLSLAAVLMAAQDFRANFSRVTSVNTIARQLQFALKLMW